MKKKRLSWKTLFGGCKVENTSFEITWTSYITTGHVDLVLYRNGTEIGIIAENIPITPGSFNWIVGSTITGGNITPGGGYVVRVKLTESPETYDDSDGSFTISSS